VKRGAAPPPAQPRRKLRLLYILLALLALLAVGFGALVVYAAHCRPEDPGWVYWHYCDWFFWGVALLVLAQSPCCVTAGGRRIVSA